MNKTLSSPRTVAALIAVALLSAPFVAGDPSASSEGNILDLSGQASDDSVVDATIATHEVFSLEVLEDLLPVVDSMERKLTIVSVALAQGTTEMDQILAPEFLASSDAVWKGSGTNLAVDDAMWGAITGDSVATDYVFYSGHGDIDITADLNLQGHETRTVVANSFVSDQTLDGRDGASLYFIAPNGRITFSSKLVAAGNGEPGQNAWGAGTGSDSVSGGHGGDGGSITAIGRTISATNTVLLPGSGGDGGFALGIGASAIGGDGGASGFVFTSDTSYAGFHEPVFLKSALIEVAGASEDEFGLAQERPKDVCETFIVGPQAGAMGTPGYKDLVVDIQAGDGGDACSQGLPATDGADGEPTRPATNDNVDGDPPNCINGGDAEDASNGGEGFLAQAGEGGTGLGQANGGDGGDAASRGARGGEGGTGGKGGHAGTQSSGCDGGAGGDAGNGGNGGVAFGGDGGDTCGIGSTGTPGSGGSAFTPGGNAGVAGSGGDGGDGAFGWSDGSDGPDGASGSSGGSGNPVPGSSGDPICS